MIEVVAEDIVKTSNVQIDPIIIIAAIREILACFGKDNAKARVEEMKPRERVRLCKRRLKESIREQGKPIPSFEELEALAEAMVDSMLNSDDDVVAACYE